MTLDPELARRAVTETIANPLGLTMEEASLGTVAVANAFMAQAVRTLPVERGFDVRDFALIAFGCAGPLYAPFLMDNLRMSQVIVRHHRGFFAAHGLPMSNFHHTTRRAFFRAVIDTVPDVAAALFRGLRACLDEQPVADGIEEAGGSSVVSLTCTTRACSTNY
jgi:N-methylhydantoinase A